MSLLVALALSELEPELRPGQFKSICHDGAFLKALIGNTNMSRMLTRTTKRLQSEENLDANLSPKYAEFLNLFNKRNSDSPTKNVTEFLFQTFQESGDEWTKDKNKTCNAPITTETNASTSKNAELKIIYCQRDLLDLGSNIRGKLELTPAILPDDITGYFENRSQISRLKGASPPSHVMVTCKEEDCTFKNPVYL